MADSTTTALTHQLDHQMSLVSHFYPPIYPQLPPHQEAEAVAAKPRRRRRRNKSGAGMTGLRKRKLSEEQASLLERSFVDEHKLESERKDRLASELGLDPRQVAVWFQNRRARWKSKKLEGEYNRVKTELETTVVEKRLLEFQVLELKQQLCEAESKLHQKISSERGEVLSSNSPSTSSFPKQEGPTFYGECFGMDGVTMDNVFYLDEYDNYGGGHVGDQWIHQLCGM